MSGYAPLATSWTALSVLALLACERAGYLRSVWFAKPAASLGFVAVAWCVAGCGSTYACLVFAALSASALGDVLLIPRGGGAAFLAGLGCFALGHALFAAAFVTTRPTAWAVIVAALGMLAIARATLRWLDPHLERALYWPLRAYILVIGAMVATAIGASLSTGDVRIALGATAFAASDLSVARERFVRPGFGNLVWGLPLYYAAQLLLAWSGGRGLPP